MNYCFNCMNEIAEGTVCPCCKHENIPDNVIYRLKPGTVLNKKFLVGNCLGEGGFGITYIGRDLTLDRKVAIKEYFPNGYVNRNNSVDQNVTAITEQQRDFFQKGLKNFLEEARRIAKLTDVPGIVDVREYFEENGTAYIIMEYLEGINLSTYLKISGLFTPENIFMLMLPITYSLQKIHESGIIHRDISPDNIMYQSNGTLRLMDFGSARYFTNEEREMSVILKQGYAPEEQYSKNGEQGPWTDVYALCATMYRCITGRVPANAIDRIKQDTLIPPSELGIKISEPIQNTLLYGLAVFKNDRCQSMQELSFLMEKALANQNIRLESANFYNRVNQTMIANDIAPPETYRNNQPTPQNRYGMNAPIPPQNQYRMNGPIPPQNQFGANIPPQNTRKPIYEKPSKAPIIIAITIFLCISIIAGAVIYLFMNNGSRIEPTVIHATASPAADASEQVDQNGASQEDDNSSSSSNSPSPTSPSPTKPAATTPVTPADPVVVTGASASSVHENMGSKYYEADNVLTKNDTCWCPTENSGVGQWIKLNLSSKSTVSGIEMINGYAGNETQYSNNRKVTHIKIEFSDGSSVQRTLTVYNNAKRKTVQTLAFNPVETTYVKITILGVKEADGKDACKDTCITYISLIK